MSDELIEKKDDALIAAIDRQGIGDLLKPLIKEIHLFDTFISGTARLKDPSVLLGIAPGDKLILRREADRFDENTVAVFTERGEALGILPEQDNVIFARLMDAGKLLTAKISSTAVIGSFHQIRIGIYLTDF